MYFALSSPASARASAFKRRRFSSANGFTGAALGPRFWLRWTLAAASRSWRHRTRSDE